MDKRCPSLLALLSFASLPLAAWAVQPADVGLQSICERIVVIQSEQLALDQKLQADGMAPLLRAHAYWHYKALQIEKCRIEQELAQMKRLEGGSLVKFVTQ